MNLTRRDFFIKSSQGIVIAAFPAVISGLLEGCNSSPTGNTDLTSDLSTIQGTKNGNIVTVNIDSSSPLAAVGGAAIINFSGGSVMADHPSEGAYNALSRTCTHQGCIIGNFDKSSKQFVCGCHLSRFTESGNVAQGPAASPLINYQTSFANNTLSIVVG